METTLLQSVLRSFIDDHLPALQRLEVAVEHADDTLVILSAPMELNHNDKGTAFGGSQVMLALSAAWALTHVNMVSGGELDPQYVVAELSMRYFSPVVGDRFFGVAKRQQQQPGQQGLLDFVQAAKAEQKQTVSVESAITSVNPLSQIDDFVANSKLTARFALV